MLKGNSDYKTGTKLRGEIMMEKNISTESKKCMKN